MEREKRKICVLGLGYIGLPTAALMATTEFNVIGVDVCEETVSTINAGDVHIEEPGLHTVVRAAIQSGNLQASTAPEPADVFIIAVPTPISRDKTSDMSYVQNATESILPHLKRGNLVILESTSPPGTCEKMLKPLLEKSGLEVGVDVHLAHCPERVLPGKILKELLENDRVIGGFTPECAKRARDIYARFVEGELLLTDCTTAEMAKITENTFRDVNISLANEIALMCEEMGISYWELARFVNRHPRVQLHAAGPGVGGHCISVDPWFLVEKFPALGEMVHLARNKNDAMPGHVVNKIMGIIAEVNDPKVALLGMTYKENIDDIRESPSLEVAKLLDNKGVQIAFCDPYLSKAPYDLFSIEDCLRDADCAVLLTAHDAFNEIVPSEAASLMRGKTLYDTRNALCHADWREAGFEVVLLGVG